jgi:hypothetical protein
MLRHVKSRTGNSPTRNHTGRSHRRHRLSDQQGRARRSSATRPDNVRTEYGQPIRSPITVAGIRGNACNSSRIRGSNSSTTDPAGLRRYAGGPSLLNAAFTVFLEQPINGRTLRSTHPPTGAAGESQPNPPPSTPASSPARLEPGSREAGQFSVGRVLVNVATRTVLGG